MKLAGGVVAIALMLLSLAQVVSGEVVQRRGVRVTMSGELSPKRLPADRKAPASVTVGGEVSSPDGGVPPQLKAIRIEINRHGRLDDTGLPVCRMAQISSASSSRALASCRSALVGEGRFTANILLPEQEPYPTSGRLLLFNGRQAGQQALFAQIYAPRPFATSFVITFAVARIARGSFGTTLTADLPAALGDWGYLTGIELRLSRRYSYKGRKRSFLSASCPTPSGFKVAPFPMARLSFGFAGMGAIRETLVRSCGARKG